MCWLKTPGRAGRERAGSSSDICGGEQSVSPGPATAQLPHQHRTPT